MDSLTKFIDNRTVVKEERLGYGSQFMVGHQTYISDPAVRERIAHMSVQEVIS